jgi:CHC2 zinc finger
MQAWREPLSEADIDRARTIPIECELERRGVQLQGRGRNRAGPCPACGGKDRFAINMDKQLWNCRGCLRGGGDTISLVRHLDGLDFRGAVELLADIPSSRAGERPQAVANRATKAADNTGHNRELAMRIWREAVDPCETLVAAYLTTPPPKGRGLELPGEAWRSIRYHENCPFTGERSPAMVCLVRNIITNQPQAIQRTALHPNGTAVKRGGKTYRMGLSAIAGGAIKIDPDEDVTMGLCIGEGLETCLAGRQMGFRPV